MTTVRILVALAAALPVLARAQASAWNIDASHTRVGFSVKHLVISDVKGEFLKTSGKADLDDNDLSKSRVEATIVAASVDTREPKRDNHLRSADFLDADRCKELSFQSTKVEADASGKLTIAGNLTIRCTTKPVVLRGEITKAITDPWGNTRRGFQATTSINRRDFGVSWGGATDVTPVVGDEVKIDIQAELVKAKS